MRVPEVGFSRHPPLPFLEATPIFRQVVPVTRRYELQFMRSLMRDILNVIWNIPDTFHLRKSTILAYQTNDS